MASEKTSVHFSGGKDDWGTPPELFDQLDQEFRFGLDAAAEASNALCWAYLGPGSPLGEDALDCPWAPRVPSSSGAVWLNPPYSRLREFMAKALEESLRGVEVVCLIPARTDTRAWHESVMKADEVRLIQGRLKFNGAKAGAPFPSAIVVFTPDPGPRPLFSSYKP